MRPNHLFFKDFELSLKIYLGLVLFSIFGVILQSMTGLQALWIARVSSVALIGTGVWAMFGGYQPKAIAFAVLVLGASVELCGLYTGLPFGPYKYTQAWWPTVPLPNDHNFPLLLPFAWLMIAGGSFALVQTPANRLRSALLTALLATAFDACMEPVIVGKLGYWVWLGSSPLPYNIPLLNFAGWFGTSLTAGWLLVTGKPLPSRSKQNGAWVLGGYLLLLVVIAIFWQKPI